MNTNKGFFDEEDVPENNIGPKSYIINFEIGDYKSSCIGKGNNTQEAIQNAIILNPNGKNFVIKAKPESGRIYGTYVPKK